MDIDCDGQKNGAGDDGRCDSSWDFQPQTSFKHMVQRYGISDLNAFVHTYVVFGNEGTKPDFVNFNPRQFGMQPLSVMAVVCGNKMFYGVWGDTNGDDQPRAAVGEVSISLATLCYGKEMNGDNGHEQPDVLYIGFTGKDVVTDTSVNWKAGNAIGFERSLGKIGDRLIQRL
ncbi:hypothetical protein FZEAL_4575 [Fusarium zealandicum]|uniref:Endo-chitosanase n=1 Tax=Fusarium zealandicum TaxID=1053134 RepID=A0A8H4XLE8_9HYPO|nr:hypothetical protein FZEAL_4575 [Fusarium zealandicum]